MLKFFRIAAVPNQRSSRETDRKSVVLNWENTKRFLNILFILLVTVNIKTHKKPKNAKIN